MFRLPRITSAADDRDAEARLIERFLLDRAEADFRRLYRRLNPQMHAVARRLLGSHHASADDVAQEAWLRAMRVLACFERRSSFRSWLMGFVVNVARETLRTSDRGPVYMADPPDPVDPLSTGSSADMERAIEALPPRCRAVLMLHDIGGFTHAEIGAALDIDEGTSKSQLSRARRRLRTHIDPTRTEP